MNPPLSYLISLTTPTCGISVTIHKCQSKKSIFSHRHGWIQYLIALKLTPAFGYAFLKAFMILPIRKYKNTTSENTPLFTNFAISENKPINKELHETNKKNTNRNIIIQLHHDTSQQSVSYQTGYAV